MLKRLALIALLVLATSACTAKVTGFVLVGRTADGVPSVAVVACEGQFDVVSLFYDLNGPSPRVDARWEFTSPVTPGRGAVVFSLLAGTQPNVRVVKPLQVRSSQFSVAAGSADSGSTSEWVVSSLPSITSLRPGTFVDLDGVAHTLEAAPELCRQLLN